jgi:FAD/FMN-containing dehydrogenase
VSDTGVAGLTLGGGFGFLQRKFGATVDSLVAVEGITVDGEFVRASAEENPELFWGLKGGGGNFIVATSFEYDVHEFGPTVLSGALMYVGKEVPAALHFWRDFMVDAPDEVGAMATLQRANHLFPDELRGEIVLGISLVYSGSVEDGERVLEPLRTFGKPFADLVKPGLYTSLQRGFEEALPHKFPTHQKCGFVPVATDEYLDTAIDVIANAPQAEPGEGDLIVLPISHMGGAIGRVADDSAAVPRGNGFYWEAIAMNRDTAEDEKWRGYIDNEVERRLRPLGAPRAYLNHYSTSPGQGQEMIKWAYGEDKYARLVALKDTWDPENILRFNKNIHPSGWSED